MKEEIREKISTETIYIACDGTEFKDKEQCKKYEDSARCALLSKYKPYVIKTVTEWDLFKAGSEDYEYDLFNLQYSWQIDLLIQLDFLNYNRSKEYEELRERLEKSIGKIILIGRGDQYNGWNFYIYESIDDRISRILKHCEV